MQLDLDNISAAYDAVKRENQSLKEGIASMQQNSENQCRELVQLRSSYPQLKRELDNQKVLSDLLSGKLTAADASPVEMEKLKNENAWLKNENAFLRKNANLDSNEGRFLEEIAKLVAEKEALKVQNEVLKVKIDALCGKMISDNANHREQEAKNHKLRN